MAIIDTIWTGLPAPLGATETEGGVNFALFSAHASAVELCLFSTDGRREIKRFFLPDRTGDVWHGFVPGLAEGQLYGYRVHGAYDPNAGHRFNPNKLLIDPYTRMLSGGFTESPALYGFDPSSPDKDLSFSPIDSADQMPKSVVGTPTYRWRGDQRPRTGIEQTIIYEGHVRGLTNMHEGVPARKRGTFEGLASPAMLDHLTKLGITALELLPVQAYFPEPRLTQMGLTNYWGYNPVAYFVPQADYLGPAGQQSFQKMVKALHSAGIEVILDVVYNHTAESWEFGPTLSFRGIDNASYYRLQQDDPRSYVNDTGCGNALNMAHPAVLQLTCDSLRYWVEHMHVDGFRFDLGTTLARVADNGFSADAPLLQALRQDPVLSRVKLIMEPWDIGYGGYQLGGFPAGMCEWNDHYRDSVRRYWRADASSKPNLAGSLLGSADTFAAAHRRPSDSINFITSHDGFTLTDVVSYNHKHNHANGEANHDGHGENYSDNCGVEGATEDSAILSRRARRQRNLLATLMLSQGTPMLLAGDEFGNSQQGNNNAYCQDNEITWLDWQQMDTGLADFVQRLIAFRRSHPVFSRAHFMHGDRYADTGQKDVTWLDPDGKELQGDAWHTDTHGFGLMLCGQAGITSGPSGEDLSDDTLLILLNAGQDTLTFALPQGLTWQRALDTSQIGSEFDPAPITKQHLDCPRETLMVLSAGRQSLRQIDDDALLNALCHYYGVTQGYYNQHGTFIVTAAETKFAILRAMGVDLADKSAAKSALAAAEQVARRPLPPTVVLREAPVVELAVLEDGLPPGEVAWLIELETGDQLSGTVAPKDNSLSIQAEVPTGYHKIILNPDQPGPDVTDLIVVPQTTYKASEDNSWGLMVPLYGLTSERNWGIGDFEDLASLAEKAAAKGADFIGLNPVHALFPDQPDMFSPYSPSSREFLNILHIAPDTIEELCGTDDGRAALAAARLEAQLEATRSSELVDYEATRTLKWPLFETAYRLFSAYGDDHPRQQAYSLFSAEKGDTLKSHALYEALATDYGPDWAAWPTTLHDPASEAVQAFERGNADRIDLFAYLQWVAAEQLQAAHTRARTAGMKTGLYLDLAVGVVPGGAEVWSAPEAFAAGMSLGAPGDAANPDGQKWHLAPLDPVGQQRTGFSLFRNTLAASMRASGMLRIDHILGMNRCFWTPSEGGVAGGYVSYPLDSMLGVIALESSRHKCRIVGEDLGMVPEGFRQKLRDWGLMGCSLMMFERRLSGDLAPASDYAPDRLASLTNHDFPTMRGWWEGADFEWRAALGIGADTDQLEADRAQREKDKRLLLDHLDTMGLLPAGLSPLEAPKDYDPALNTALHAFLACTKSATITVQIEDLLALREQPNVPGTTNEQPNWRRKIPTPIETLFDDQMVKDCLHAINKGRGTKAWGTTE